LNPNINYLAVGTFVIAGITMVIVLVLWFGNGGDSTPTARYVVPIYSEVNGLSTGSAVRYLGVDVGTVREIRLNTSALPFVEILIDIRDDVPIDEATYATLIIQGITGIANIDLGSDPENMEPMETNANDVTVIPFRSTGLSAAIANSGDITSGVQQFMERLNAWTSEGNLQRVTHIIEDVENLTGVLAEQRDDIPELIAALKRTISSMERMAQNLQATAQDDLPVIVGDLKDTSGRLAGISARVDGWLADNDQSIDALLGDGFGSMAVLVGDLRVVVEDLSRLTSKMREDPSRLIYRAKHDPVVVDP